MGLASSTACVSAGIGPSGSRISVSHSTSVQDSWGPGAWQWRGRGGAHRGLQSEKVTMQCLNDLASYLERNLEADSRD